MGPTDLSAPERLDLSKASLFLDIDGTLAPFETTPDLVAATPRRTTLLRRLGVGLDGRLAIVSGRDLAAIDRILDGVVTAASGVHGLQRRRADGAMEQASPHPALGQARLQAKALAKAHPGVLVEDKALAVAIHFRQAPDACPAVDALAQALTRTGLALQRGDMVMELKTPGGDKGQAVRAFMAEAPFRGGRPLFVGDDLTDESAFQAVAHFGGFGVLVGAPRRTAAGHRLDGVDQVLDWLERSLENT